MMHPLFVFFVSLYNFAGMSKTELDRLKDPGEVENLARNIGASHIGHELVLTDTLYTVAHYTDDSCDIMRHPVKLVGASVFLCVEGSLTVKVNLTAHTIHSGEALILLPGSIMQVTDSDASPRIASLSFSNEYFERIMKMAPEIRESPRVTLSPGDMNECITLYSLLKERIALVIDQSTRVVARNYVEVICTLLFNQWENMPRENADKLSSGHELYMKFLKAVQIHYHSLRRVNDYADLLCVTPKYLSAVVKKYGKRNATEYVDELVAFESKALLRDGQYSVEQISEIMQFPSASYFARFFRRVCGCAPSDYRKNTSVF